MIVDIAKMPRDLLGLGLRAARLPLSAAEATLKRGQDTSEWAPTLAFERAAATVTGLVGNLLGDDVLRASALLQRAEMDQRAKAAVKREEAEATRQENRRRADEKAAEVEAERRRLEEASQRRQQQLEAERVRAEERIEAAAAKKRAATRAQAAATRKSIAETEAKAEATRLRKEAEALRRKQRAVDAQGEVLALDRKVKAKKAARRAG